jgi:hypothetical protein
MNMDVARHLRQVRVGAREGKAVACSASANKLGGSEQQTPSAAIPMEDTSKRMSATITQKGRSPSLRAVAVHRRIERIARF